MTSGEKQVLSLIRRCNKVIEFQAETIELLDSIVGALLRTEDGDPRKDHVPTSTIRTLGDKLEYIAQRTLQIREAIRDIKERIGTEK